MIPKPKHCEQNWLDMKPADGGRMCGQCQKKIIDFSKMKWAEIEKLQAEFNNELCGMYNPKQLDNWGREVPKNSFNKVAASTALFLSLNCTDTILAQSDSLKVNVKNTWVTGTVKSKSKNGKLTIAPFVTVVLNATQCATVSDDSGRFSLDVSDYIDTSKKMNLIFKSYGTKDLYHELNTTDFKEICIVLEEREFELSVFYVEAPTLKNRIKWKLKKWFGRNRNE